MRVVKGWPASFPQPEHFDAHLPVALYWTNLPGVARPGKPWLTAKRRVIFVNDLGGGFAPTAPLPGEWLCLHLQRMTDSPHIQD